VCALASGIHKAGVQYGTMSSNKQTPLPPKKSTLSEAQRILASQTEEHRLKYGPEQINDPLEKKDEKAASEAAKEGQALLQIYPRVSNEEIAKIINEAVRLHGEVIIARLTPLLEKTLAGITIGYLAGVMQNATWDILKHFIPYLHTMFQAEGQTDYMRRCHAAWEETRDAAPKEFHDFSAEHYRGLMALRAQTWTKLQDEIKNSELREVMSDQQIKLFLENLESSLFVPVRS